MLDDRRCAYTWENRYNETLRCMLDEGHNMFFGHQHGIQTFIPKEVERNNNASVRG